MSNFGKYLKLLNDKIMKKLLIYSMAYCLIYLLPSCENIDVENTSLPSKLVTMEDVLKNQNFIQLMNVRGIINSRLEIYSDKNSKISLSEIKTRQQFESTVIGMGFNNLKEYNDLMFLEIHYLNQLKRIVNNVDIVNRANEAYLRNELNNWSKMLKNAKTCTECINENTVTLYTLKTTKDLAINNCVFNRDNGINNCPTVFVPETTYCIPKTTFTPRTCFTFSAYYKPEDNCYNNQIAIYNNCISQANATYDAGYESALVTLLNCNATCTN